MNNFGNATINTDFMGIPVPKGKARKDKRVLFVDQQRKVIGYLVEGKRWLMVSVSELYSAVAV